MASVDEREDRRKKVAELGKTGLKPGEIAKELGITPQLAGRDLSWVRKNKPEWLEEEQDKTDPVASTEDGHPVVDDSTVVAEPSKEPVGEPITDEVPVVKTVREEEQLLDPPAPPAQDAPDKNPVDYAVHTMLGKDKNVDDRPIDEIWDDRSEPAEYGPRERFMDMSDDEKWDYMQHKVTTDFILIACVAIVIILILSILYSMR